MNAVELEICRNLFESIADEMGAVLMRAAFSSNIRERLDFSCAVFDPAGEMVAQAAHIPVHLGATPMSVKAAIAQVEMEPGVDVILNDPYSGGSHLPDITLVRPIFREGEIVMYVCNRAHHADVGGKSPGSMGIETRLEDEGIVLQPQPLTDEVVAAIGAAVATPAERIGDLLAQRAANSRGEARVLQLLENRPGLYDGISELQQHGEKMMRAVLRQLPNGCADAVGVLEGDGISDQEIEIRCRVTLDGDQATVDFSGSDLECQGPMNAPRAVTISAVGYVFRCLAPATLPTNAGYMRCVEVKTEQGSIVHATSPRPVALGNVETSQRIVDTVFRALSQIVPETIPADSYGSMNNVLFSMKTAQGELAYYETIGGGAGANRLSDGASAVQCHMTNTRNTPIESFERDFPVQIVRYGIRKGSGGKGEKCGGDGIIRGYLFHAPALVSLMTDRFVNSPKGIDGGGDARPTTASLDGVSLVRGKTTIEVAPGSTLVVETGGGGGWGDEC